MWSVQATQRRTRHAARGKEELLQATVKVIAQRGLEQARFVDIAAATGVAISSLQYFFGAREDLLLAAVGHAAQQEIELLQDVATRRLDAHQRLRQLLHLALGDPSRCAESRLFWNEVRNGALRNPELRAPYMRMYEAWASMIEDTLERGKQTGAFARSVNPRPAALQILAVIDGLTTPLLVEDPAVEDKNAYQLASEVVESLLGIDRSLVEIA
ncbi:MAG TPA: TetR/AcrR family transcriptional regulator [Chloroflexota bacterium]|nr:TetR/AcrR family transcriptional regulator [Chloroflexota bacterium]